MTSGISLPIRGRKKRYKDSAHEKRNILYVLYMWYHHIYKHIPISFEVMTTWNQEMFFFYSLCIYLESSVLTTVYVMFFYVVLISITLLFYNW